MKTAQIITTWIVSMILIIGGVALSGCASAQHSDTESMLSAAGFHAMTPTTAQQQAFYAALTPYELQQHDFNGKIVYAYANTKAGIVYIGNDSNYQRYHQLVFQKKITDEQVAAAEMNQTAAMNWGFWGAGMW